jgi:hypothetical protein
MTLRPAIRLPILRIAGLAALLVAAQPGLAAEQQACTAGVLSVLGRELQVAHFVPEPAFFGKDPQGVIKTAACKRLPDDPRLTLVAVAWDAGKADAKSLAVAIVDETTSTLVSLSREEIGEDAATQVDNGSLRLDTAPYELAPGVRAYGVDVFTEDRSCGDGAVGPVRTLYVREGRALRPVLEGLAVSQYRYLRGGPPHCAADPAEAASAILEDNQVSIGLGAAGRDGWRDLLLTASSKRSDHQPSRKPLRVRVRHDAQGYPLDVFNQAYARWRQ